MSVAVEGEREVGEKKDAREEMTQNSLHDSIASQLLVRGIISKLNLFQLDSQAN